MAIPSINNLIKYINIKFTGANWNTNFQQIVNWFTDGTADVSFNSITGDLTGDITGNVTGNLNGNVTGDVTGNVAGNLTGNLIGDIYASNGTSKILDNGTDGSNFSSPLQPVGAMQMYAGSTAPTGFLICNGDAVSRTTYSALFAIISTTYGAGDTTTTFNLPDMRETYAVGVGTRGSGVTAHDTFTLGQFKDDQMQGHNHTTSADNLAAGSGIASGANYSNNFSTVTTAITDGTNGTPRIGTTTRGKAIGLNYIIKY